AFESFTYTVTDGFNESTATLENPGEVTINLTNELPLANGGFATTPKEVAVDITEAAVVPGVIEFVIGQDPDGDPVWISDYTPPSEGTLTPIYDSGDPTKIIGFTYDPGTADLSGASFDATGFAAAFESFTYTVTDGFNESTATIENPGEVVINLTNELPLANGGWATTPKEDAVDITEDTAAVSPLIEFVIGQDADGDPIWISDYTLPSEGTLTPIYDSGDPTKIIGFTYDPGTADLSGASFNDAGFAAAFESFTYKVTDGFNESTATLENPGEVTINLRNRLPVARPDNYSMDETDVSLVVPEESGVIIDHLDGVDFDPDGDELTAFLIGGGFTQQGGTIELNGDGSFTYIPPDDFAGEDSFWYYVSDGFNNSDIVYVRITVPLPPAPLVPAAPLPELPIPELEGCPVLLEAVAAELGIGKEGLQISMGTGLALNPNLQPCNACARLLNAATMLADANSANVAALAMVIDEFISPDVPPTEEQMASIAVAFAEHANDDTHYAAAGQWVDALLAYVEVLTDDLGWSAPRAATQMDKYIGPISEGDYASAAAYAALLLAGLGG
ncbi:MAG: Ig-like domain-containing protein, partial [Planctomycetota bacterium]